MRRSPTPNPNPTPTPTPTPNPNPNPNLEQEHTATQEKISLLTEATFAITNMLAGVQARQAAR